MRGRGRRLYALILGLISGMLMLSLVKTLEFLMLINFISLLYTSASLLCFSFGAANPSKIRGTDFRYQAILLAALVALASACLLNRDFTSLALFGFIYYPVPLPKSGIVNQIALWFVLLGGPLFFYPLGRSLSEEIGQGEKSAARHTITAYLAGFAAGVGLVYAFSFISPFLLLVVALALYAISLLRLSAAAVGVVAVSAAYFFMLQNPARTFFLWGITDYEYKGGGYGRDVKVDFVSFFDDTCLGTVIDNAMMTCECKNLDWIPTEFDYILRTLVDPFDPPPPKFEKIKGVPQPGNRKKGLDVLDVGRSGGGNCRALEIYTGPNNNAAIEFEPAVSLRVLEQFTDYTKGIYLRPGSEVYTGDFRTNLELLASQGRKFDYIFLSGIGTKTYILPRSYVFSEHFLLTEEGTSLIFDKLLKPGGFFYLDWGSSATREAKWFVASFPDDVHTVAYWTTQSEYPFSGSPQVYVIASKDGRKMAAVEKRIDRLTDFRNVDYRPNLDKFRTSDNRPFLQNDLQAIIAAFHLLLALISIPVVSAMRRRVDDRFGMTFKTGAGFWMAGIAAGFGESLFACFNPFINGPFGIPSWAALDFVFLAGLAVGFGLFPARLTRGKTAPILILALTIAGTTGLFALKGSDMVYLAPLLAAVGIGMLPVRLAPGFSAKQWVGAVALFFLGTSLAMVYHKVPFYIGGYTAIAAIVCLLVVTVVIRWRPRGNSGI